MSALDSQLVIFSWFVIILFGSMIIIPTLKKRRELFSYWNAFLLGGILFNGFSGFNAANQTGEAHHHTYSSIDYYLYYIGFLAFYGSFFLGYSWLKMPRKLAGRTFLKWPPVNSYSLFLMSVVALGFTAFSLYPLPVPVLGKLFIQLGAVAPAISMAFAFLYWTRNRYNLFAIALFATAFFVTMIIASTGISRRMLLNALVVFPAGIYWIWLRDKNVVKLLLWLGLVVVVCVPVIRGYTAIRHRESLVGKYGVERALLSLKMLPAAIMKGGASEGFTGQNSVEVGLSTIYCVRTKSFEGVEMTPFASVRFILANPVPRVFWENKPRSLGIILPQELGVWRYSRINWGVNVVGQCFYDGGLYIHVLYGLIFGMFLRYLDEQLIRKPGNPFMIAAFCASASQVLAMSRGGIEIFSMQIIAAFAMVGLLWALTRILFGVKHVDPNTSHIDDAWEAGKSGDSQVWLIMAPSRSSNEK